MDYKLLQKFYNNQCSEEELKEILSWFEDTDQERSTLASIEMHWHQFENDENQKQETINDLKERINGYLGNEYGIPVLKSSEERKRKKLRNIYFKVAATLLLVVGVSYIIWKLNQANNFGGSDQQINEISNIIKENPKGQKLKVMLKDGSVVTLNAESQIEYNENFGSTNRDIRLVGEAFFEVEHNKELPFIVSAGNISVTAIGTSFSVQDYPENKQSFVALSSGKVSVSRSAQDSLAGKDTFLSPGEMIVFNKEDGKLMAKQNFNEKNILGWKEGLLVFRQNNFHEVKKRLERWYGVEIIVDNTNFNPNWNYSGQYNNVSLENVLQGISFTKSFDFSIEGEKIYVNFK